MCRKEYGYGDSACMPYQVILAGRLPSHKKREYTFGNNFLIGLLLGKFFAFLRVELRTNAISLQSFTHPHFTALQVLKQYRCRNYTSFRFFSLFRFCLFPPRHTSIIQEIIKINCGFFGKMVANRIHNIFLRHPSTVRSRANAKSFKT